MFLQIGEKLEKMQPGRCNAHRSSRD